MVFLEFIDYLENGKVPSDKVYKSSSAKRSVRATLKITCSLQQVSKKVLASNLNGYYNNLGEKATVSTIMPDISDGYYLNLDILGTNKIKSIIPENGSLNGTLTENYLFKENAKITLADGYYFINSGVTSTSMTVSPLAKDTDKFIIYNKSSNKDVEVLNVKTLDLFKFIVYEINQSTISANVEFTTIAGTKKSDTYKNYTFSANSYPELTANNGKYYFTEDLQTYEYYEGLEKINSSFGDSLNFEGWDLKKLPNNFFRGLGKDIKIYVDDDTFPTNEYGLISASYYNFAGTFHKKIYKYYKIGELQFINPYYSDYLERKLNKLEAELDAKLTEITTNLETSLANTNKNVTNNTTKISNLETSLANTNKNVTNNTTSINSINSRLDKLIKVLTEEEYQNLKTKDENTMYLISEE